MEKYTIGAVFTPDFEKVLLIEKKRPNWQKGRLNFPGGHFEENETGYMCVAREFYEEAAVVIPPNEWQHIGLIENEGEYLCEFFTAIYDEARHGKIQSNTEEVCLWVYTKAIPDLVISNLKWLIPFAVNYHQQGNADGLVFGHFSYKYV